MRGNPVNEAFMSGADSGRMERTCFSLRVERVSA